MGRDITGMPCSVTAAVNFLRRWEAYGVKIAPKAKLLWPKTLPEQVQAVRAGLASAAAPLSAETIARTFQRARADKVGELLETLAALGQVREVEPGSFVV